MKKLVLLLVWLSAGQMAWAQTMDITFRYIPNPNALPVRVFLPGQFNNWGPNANGVIAAGAISEMTKDAAGGYRKTLKLNLGQSYMYKMHLHQNSSGTSNQWVSDPLNPKVNPADNNNSVLDVVSPLAFQPAKESDTSGAVLAISVGLFSTAGIKSITFEVNGKAQDNAISYFDAASGIFRYVPSTPLASGTGFKIVATDGAGKTATAEMAQEVLPKITKAPRPVGAIEGANLDPNDPTKATLVLYAPKKQYVYAIGDFSNWEAKEAYLMKKDSTAVDRVYWWTTVPVTPGVETGYQFLVDGKIRIADPYTTKILSSSDTSIPTSTYPNLKPYPTGKTSYEVSVLQTLKPAYAWQATNYQRPPQHKLVIYELLVRDFSSARTFQAVIDSLGYLKKLGVNAIQLMPVAEFSGNESWGYNPDFYFAVDKYYGTEQALKKLIDTCHQNGMAVILDVVYNHMTGSSPFARLYNDSPTGDPAAAISTSNYWLNRVAKHPFNVFNDVNHEAWQMQALLDRVNAYWLKEFKVDGFRFDLSKGFTQYDSGSDVGAMGRYDASRVRILKRMADEIWKVDGSAYVILEHFADNTEEKELAEYGTTAGKPGMMLWGNANYNFSEAAMGWHDSGKSNFEWAYYGARGWKLPHLVSYMESHDEERMMYRNVNFGNADATGKYKIKDLWVGLERQKLAGAFLFTMPGPKMIWQFGEVGYDVSIDFNGRVGNKPVRWQYAQDPTRQRLYKTWAALLKLRHENPVFTDPQTQVSYDFSQSVKRMHLSHPSMNVTILGNFNVNTVNITPRFQTVGTWYDYFSGQALSVTDVTAPISLLPGEFRIYTSQKVATPESGLIRVDAEADEIVQLRAFTLAGNYPNPFNPSTSIRYTVPKEAELKLEVFDSLGRKVATLFEGIQAVGQHEVAFEAANLPSGLYIVRLQAGSAVQNHRMMLVK